ncbi:MAG: 23S rRNA (uracil(1939)-C(5))-methyltransferase RlmD [Epulopiscium sp.]|jgi:23S rRNA (uracil1939-C5)-methyltransferase|nr:23S rRNA (uracil(1939)-C(5))-methyltransferase RlmD [Candidatus Epulonipiscium sp.]
MKKNDIIELAIEKVSFPNKGIGYIEDYPVTVKNTLPGQIVSVRIRKKRQSGIEGQLLEVVHPAPNQKPSGCSHFSLCGGCTYQHIPYEDELCLKETQVKELLDKAGIHGYQWEGIEPSPNQTGYRNKCEFSFGDEEKGGDLALGMRKRQSFYEVVTLSDCNIIDEDYLQILKATLEFFKQKNIPFYHKMRHDGVLRHLVVRKSVSTEEILINLITVSNYGFSPEEYANHLLSLSLKGNISGILHTLNDGVADVVQSDHTELLYGKDYFTEKLFDLKFKVSAFSFFQTNSLGAERLYSVVMDFVGEADQKTIFDLYCGTGTIGQIVAKKAKQVFGIELVEEAVNAANENAQQNQLTNCHFICGDVLKKIDELHEKPDCIILDPPRDGIHPKAIGKIINFNAPEIVYVSCKPTSLARDLQIFQQEGYEVKRIRLVDMFPRTVHVETVVLMSRV